MKKKSYKRELAITLLIWLGYIVETKSAEIISILVWPVFTFAGAAFGFHSYATQLQQAQSSGPPLGGTERSGEYTSGERERSGSVKPDNPERG